MLQLEELTETSGLNIKAKVGSSWVAPIPHVNVAGTWTKVKKAYGKVGSTWEQTYQYESVFTFAATEHTDVDLDSLSLDRYHNVRVVIPSGATLVASSTSVYALKTGTSHTAKLTIENNGAILGRGGNGGNGGLGYSYNAIAHATDGTVGGVAVHLESDITLINNGTLSGGGGGGGGAEGYVHTGTAYGGGGGGGGGRPYGAGGNGGSTTHSGTAGSAGTLASEGTGGTGGYDGTVRGGIGGSGGAEGSAGSQGGEITGDHGHVVESNKGIGGAAGATYYNPSSFTIS